MDEIKKKPHHAVGNKNGVQRMSIPKKKAAFLRALEMSHGVITPACKSVPISRGTYYNWLSKDPKFALKVKESVSEAVDFVESQIMKNIENGKEISAIYFLKCKGGPQWREQQHVDITTGGEKINFTFGSTEPVIKIDSNDPDISEAQVE